jgi:release factor glutamine methyltransferase
VATLEALLERAARALGSRREAEAVIGAALGLTRAEIAMDPARAVVGDARARAESWCARRAAGEPLAYLTGEREFWSLTFAVTPDVLVPRPETELVVARALDLLPDGAHAVVDLGTGSGCIAVALAHERREWRVTATDASPAALEVARANAEHHVPRRITVLGGAWYAPLAGRRFQLIVSNPPYVGAAEPAMDDATLRFEPRTALTPGEDAFAALAEIIDGAAAHLLPGGAIVLEHGATQAREVASRLVARGFAHVICAPDLAGHDRVTSAIRPATT